MKARALIACITILAAFAFLAACQPDTVAETASCMECHSGDTTPDRDILAANAQYEESGHFLGPRTLDPYVANTGHIYVFHGSNAMYTNGTPCSKCHTHQGFVEYVTTGTVINLGAASQPGCFSCHKPHVSGDFSMRKETSETLVDTTVFDYGKGNLCATCHKAMTDQVFFLDPAATVNSSTPAQWIEGWRSSSGPHHGPQADFGLGKNHWAYGANTYQGASIHFTSASAPDSCVDCHMYQPASRLGGTLSLGGHGMYLTGDVHGTNTDIIASCKTCHNGTIATNYPSTSTTFADNGHPAPANWDGDGSTEDKILEIKGLRDTLISYFGNGANFSGAGTSPIVGVDDGLNQTTGEWNLDWEFNPTTTTFTLVVSQSLWNFKYFIEDKSQGVHNPTFAAQILYDAIDNLNDNAAAGLTLGLTRPN